MAEERNGELRMIAGALDSIRDDLREFRIEHRDALERVHGRIDVLAQQGLPERLDAVEGRVNKLEGNWSWLFRGVLMALMAGAVGLLFTQRLLP